MSCATARARRRPRAHNHHDLQWASRESLGQTQTRSLLRLAFSPIRFPNPPIRDPQATISQTVEETTVDWPGTCSETAEFAALLRRRRGATAAAAAAPDPTSTPRLEVFRRRRRHRRAVLPARMKHEPPTERTQPDTKITFPILSRSSLDHIIPRPRASSCDLHSRLLPAIAALGECKLNSQPETPASIDDGAVDDAEAALATVTFSLGLRRSMASPTSTNSLLAAAACLASRRKRSITHKTRPFPAKTV